MGKPSSTRLVKRQSPPGKPTYVDILQNYVIHSTIFSFLHDIRDVVTFYRFYPNEGGETKCTFDRKLRDWKELNITGGVLNVRSLLRKPTVLSVDHLNGMEKFRLKSVSILCRGFSMKHFENLVELSLENCSTRKQLNLSKVCPRMETLIVRSNTGLQIVRPPKNLKVLDASESPHLLTVSKLPTTLQTLLVNGCRSLRFDASKCPDLKVLECCRCNLKTLNVFDNRNLLRLVCNGNQINYLYLGTNRLLEELYCNDNFLEDIIFPAGEANLIILEAARNRLFQVPDIQNLRSLKYLDLSFNLLRRLFLDVYLPLLNGNLNTIDVHGNPWLRLIDLRMAMRLQHLDCSQCDLWSLDVNPTLQTLNCSENYKLRILDLVNNDSLEMLDCTYTFPRLLLKLNVRAPLRTFMYGTNAVITYHDF